MIKPFASARIHDLLTIKDQANLTLMNRESDDIEFKLSFNIEDEVTLRTFASFANNKGGYIVCGVENNTRRLIGLSDRKFKKFEQYDKRRAENILNQYLSPTIFFEMHTQEWFGKQIGIIYVHEALYKPVIFTKNAFSNKIKEGDIYYSYNAERTRIRYPDLAHILQERANRNVRDFMKHLDTILRIGVENAAIMDTEDGTVVGPKIKSFIIDEELLDQLKFVKEGEFKEKLGAPTLKLIGNLTTSTQGLAPIKTYLAKEDIFEDFLSQVEVPNPLDYLRLCVTGGTKWIPLYYYIYLADLSIHEAMEEINNIHTNSLSYKQRILDRLKSTDDLREPLKATENKASLQKHEYRRKLVNRQDIKTDEEKHRYVLYAILSLQRHEVEEKYMLKVLKYLYDSFYDSDKNTGVSIRKAICHIDRLLFREKIN